MRPIRAVIYGVGAMGALTTKLCIESGIEIVGAIAKSPQKVGQDLGKVVGLDEPLGVWVRDDARAVLIETRPDIALVSVASYLSVMAPHFRTCVEAGVNVITLEEETLYPWESSPDLAEEIDTLARAHGVTVMATGLQDVFWIDMARSLMSASHSIRSVRGRSTWNSDDYGPEVEANLFIGQDPAAVAASGVFDKWDRRTVRSSLMALATLHDLTVTDTNVRIVPIVRERDTTSPVTGRVVPAGRILGTSNIVTIRTRQGIELQLEMSGYLHGPGESSVNEWVIDGEPQLSVRTDPFPGQVVTCTAVLNRIPDAIAARPGLLSVDQMPPMQFRAGPMFVN